MQKLRSNWARAAGEREGRWSPAIGDMDALLGNLAKIPLRACRTRAES